MVAETSYDKINPQFRQKSIFNGKEASRKSFDIRMGDQRERENEKFRGAILRSQEGKVGYGEFEFV